MCGVGLKKCTKTKGQTKAGKDQMTNGDKLWRWRLKLLICRVEYPLFFFFLSNQLYTPFTEQYYYKSYGLQLIENTSTFNRDPGEAFCLTEELLTNYSGDNDTFKQVQSSANHLVAYGSLVKNIVSIVLSTLVYGPLTNRYGRKIGIVAPGIGALCQGIMAFFIIKFNLNPYYFLLAYLATGLGGDFTSILSSAFAYTADVSTMKYRSFRIGAIEASIALGGAVGVLSGGYLLESVHCNFIPPLILYLVSNAAVILFVLFVLPESTTAKERRKGAKTMKEEFIKYLKGFRMYCGELSFKKTWNVYVATIAANIASFAVVGSIILAVFFLKTSPFDLSPFKIGIYQSVRSLSQGLANIIVPGVFTLLLRNPDPWLILVAFLFSGVGYLLVGFSTQPWQIYLRKL